MMIYHVIYGRVNRKICCGGVQESNKEEDGELLLICHGGEVFV